MVTNSSDLSQALRNPQISLIILDPSGQNVSVLFASIDLQCWPDARIQRQSCA